MFNIISLFFSLSSCINHVDGDSPVSILRNINFPWLTGGLRATGEIHGISEQAIARHPVTNHAGNHFTTVYSDRDFLQNNNAMRNLRRREM